MTRAFSNLAALIILTSGFAVIEFAVLDQYKTPVSIGYAMGVGAALLTWGAVILIHKIGSAYQSPKTDLQESSLEESD